MPTTRPFGRGSGPLQRFPIVLVPLALDTVDYLQKKWLAKEVPMLVITAHVQTILVNRMPGLAHEALLSFIRRQRMP